MSEIQAKIAELEAEMVGAAGCCDCRPTTSTTMAGRHQSWWCCDHRLPVSLTSLTVTGFYRMLQARTQKNKATNYHLG
jgi:hypothetical protein